MLSLVCRKVVSQGDSVREKQKVKKMRKEGEIRKGCLVDREKKSGLVASSSWADASLGEDHAKTTGARSSFCTLRLPTQASTWLLPLTPFMIDFFDCGVEFELNRTLYMYGVWLIVFCLPNALR